MKLTGKINDFPAETLLLVRVSIPRQGARCEGGMLNPDSARSAHRKKVGRLVRDYVTKLQVRTTGLEGKEVGEFGRF